MSNEVFVAPERAALHPLQSLPGFVEFLHPERKAKFLSIPPEKVNVKVLTIVQTEIEKAKQEKNVVKTEIEVIQPHETEVVQPQAKQKIAEAAAVAEMDATLRAGGPVNEAKLARGMTALAANNIPLKDALEAKETDPNHFGKGLSSQLKSENRFALAADVEHRNNDVNPQLDIWPRLFHGDLDFYFVSKQTKLDFAKAVQTNFDSVDPYYLEGAVMAVASLDKDSLFGAFTKMGVLYTDHTLNPEAMKNWLKGNTDAIEKRNFAALKSMTQLAQMQADPDPANAAAQPPQSDAISHTASGTTPEADLPRAA